MALLGAQEIFSGSIGGSVNRRGNCSRLRCTDFAERPDRLFGAGIECTPRVADTEVRRFGLQLKAIGRMRLEEAFMFPSPVRRRSKPVPFGEMSTEGAAAVAAQIPVPRGELCTAARR